MSMPPTALTVTVSGHPAGQLTGGERNRFSFQYASDAQTAEVSLTMPWRALPWPFDGVHPVFAQNLPEGYLRAVLSKSISKTYGSGDLALLSCLGPYQIGRVGYLPVDAPTPAATSGETLDGLLSSKDPQLFDQLVEKYALRSGISGIQPKVLVDIKDKGTIRSGQLIVKSWGNDFPQLALNEYYCMRVAKLAGLTVPRFDVSADGRLFVMERFDVTERGDFLGFEDTCSLMALMPAEKYDSTYERLVSTVRTFVSPNRVHASMVELYTSLLVSWIVRNGDAHLKNFGLLYPDTAGDVRLAPAFDIVSTTVYISADTPALQLGGSKRWWKPKMLEMLGRQHCQLSPLIIRQQMTSVLHAVTDVLAEMALAPTHFDSIGPLMIEQWTAAQAELAVYMDSTAP